MSRPAAQEAMTLRFTASVAHSPRRRKSPVREPRGPAGGLRRVLRGAGAAPVAVSTPRGALRPYRRALLPDGRLAFRKRAEPFHELRWPPGIAVDEDVLAAAERAGVSGIVIERVATGEVLFAPVARWRTGVPVRRGYGAQRALRWSQLELVRAAETPAVAQTSLFTGVAP
jgi:hypothetical protein